MSLLAPWALWFGLVAAGVVALYLLKIKRRQQTVPALDFWLQLAGRTKVHSLFDRLKRLLSMLLWLAVVACLVLSLGNPIFSLGRIKPRAIAVVIDNSASMQTLEQDAGGGGGVGSRLDLARRALADLTTRRPVSDEWLLIEAAREPRVCHPWTYDAKSLRAACDAIEPFAGAGDLSAAVALAGQLLAGKPDPCIVVISDGAAGAIDALAKADPRIVYWPVGRTRDNLGITRLAVRPHRQHGNHHALIAVANDSDQHIDTQLTLEIDGSIHSVELVSVAPGQTWEKTVVIESSVAAEGAILRASLDRPDALLFDNEAFAPLDPIRPAVVWLVSSPDSAFFFEQALGSMDPLVWAEESLTLAPEQYEHAVAAASPADGSEATLRPPDLVIFNNCAPPSLPPSGRFIFLNVWPKEIPAVAAGEITAPQLFLAPRPHPLTQHVSLQGVRLARATRITLTGTGSGGGVTTLAHTPEGDPLIFLAEDPGRQSLCLAFDVHESDMPFRNAFPLLLRNAVAYMHAEAPSWLRPEYRIGESVQPLRPLPPDIEQVTLSVHRAGDRETRILPVRSSRFVFDDTGRAGALRLTVAGEPSLAALAIGDPAESRITPFPAAEDPAEKLVLSGRLLGSMPWLALAAAATLLVTLEWLTFHFRWTE